MPQTHLIFDPQFDEYGLKANAELVLSGTVEVSPLVRLNAISYVLYASYTHADQTTENFYRSLLCPLDHDTTK